MIAPPLLVSFPDAQSFLSVLNEECRVRCSQEVIYHSSRKLPPIVSKRSLAVLFGYSPRFVGAMCVRPQRYYRHFLIPKGKKSRKIDAPRTSLKVIQTWFGYHLSRAIVLPDCVHGFVPGRSTTSAAHVHCGAEWVVTLDIQDFFPSTGESHIRDCLLELGYSNEGTTLILQLMTLDGYLPQGSPASPVLSNLAFQHSDWEIIQLCQKFCIQYTRYADDLVFSGKGQVPDTLVNDVTKIIERRGWRIASSKTRIRHLPQSLKVLGLLVHGAIPRLPKRYRNQLRAMKHLLDTKSLSEPTLKVFKGHVAYAMSTSQTGNGTRKG